MRVDPSTLTYVRYHIHMLAQIAPKFCREHRGRTELMLGQNGRLLARVFFGDMLVDEYEPEVMSC